MKKLGFGQIIRDEKRQMNPIRWKINYILVPIVLAVFIVCIVIGGTLMSIDEEKYAIAFVVLVCGGFLPLLSMLFFMPLIRRKETEIEAGKYDFDEPAEECETYVWEKEIRHVGYEIEGTAFAEFDSAEQIAGAANLGNRLHELLDGRNVLSDEISPLPQAPFHIADDTEDGRLSRFRLTVSTSERTRVDITEMQRLAFSAQGMTVNGVLFPWEEITVRVFTSNYLLLARIHLGLFVFDRTVPTEGPYSPTLVNVKLKLDKRVRRLVEQFGVKLENRPVYDYIVAHKREAIYQILKYGTVKKIK